jgi:hypothetical protein
MKKIGILEHFMKTYQLEPRKIANLLQFLWLYNTALDKRRYTLTKKYNCYVVLRIVEG